MPRIVPHERGEDGTAFAIRRICDEDEETVAELWHACGLVRSWNDPHGDIGRARANASSEIFVAVAQDSGGIAGSIMAGNDGHRGWVYFVAVTQEHRLQGLGERLIRHAEAWLHRLGARRVNLTIREENAAARRFYEGLGYAIEKRIVMSRWTGEGG